MSTKLPMTYIYEFGDISADHRRFILAEFAANGIRNLVFTDEWIARIMQTPTLADELQKDMDSFGLTFMDAHAPFSPKLDLNCPFPEYRKQMIARQNLSLAITADMGVKVIVIHVGNTNIPETAALPLEKHHDNICRALDAILPQAEDLGVTVAIENIWFMTNTPEFLWEIKNKFPTDALGFCYDSGHANLMSKGHLYPDGAANRAWRSYAGIEPRWDDQILEKLLPEIVCCHLHDNDGSVDQHRMPGKGNIDWQHILPVLKTAPKLQSVQSEVLCKHSLQPISETCRAFRERIDFAE